MDDDQAKTPAAERPPEPPSAGSERETLVQFLENQRGLFLAKVGGLTAEQFHSPVAPSSLTLGGLLHHMAMVEDVWFSVRFLGNERAEPWASADWDADWDWEFNSASTTATDEIYRRYEDAVAASRAVVDGVDDLSAVSKVAARHDGGYKSMRWILIHMIEEYARHLGHADYLREAIDGSTGDFDD